MANGLYDSGRAAFGNAGIALLTDTISVQLVDTTQYTVNLATHAFLSDVPVGARVGTAAPLGTKTNVAGVFGAANASVTGLTGAPAIQALVIYKDTGTPGTSQLIAYIDTATGLPTPAGASRVDITWDTGANKIFKL